MVSQTSKDCLWQTGIVGIRLMRLASHFEVSPQVVELVTQCGVLVSSSDPELRPGDPSYVSGWVIKGGVILGV